LIVTFKSRQLWSCMSTSWNRLEVNFPMQETVCPLDFPLKRYDQIGEDCARTQQSHEAVRDFSSWWLFTSRNSPETQRSIHTQQGGLFLV
jgi:carboxypeptidase C (cathepsin A)